MTKRETTKTSHKLSRWMDQIECNDTVNSTPLTSPTVQHRSSTMAATQPALSRPPQHEAPQSGRIIVQADPGTSRGAGQIPTHSTFNRDAVVQGLDVLRYIPSISSAITQLLAFYDPQVVQDALPGKGHMTRWRYNTTDTTLADPQFRWPNEGLVTAYHSKKTSLT